VSAQAERQRVAAADEYCRHLLRHYENFTVASRLTPRPLRRDLTRVYAFCRTTDDFGDESGESTLATRRLTDWRTEVEALFAGSTSLHPVLVALAPTIERHGLPAQPFLDLIDANLQDQRVSSYEDWDALLGYCRLSAAPVGRMVLRLFGVDDPHAVALSDDVCIGLQLANFAQDVSVDARRGRTYLLQRDIRSSGVVGATRAMCERARELLASGNELETIAPLRLRVQLALYRLGGEAILDAIASVGYDTRTRRPVVAPSARVRIAGSAIRDVIRGRRRGIRGRGRGGVAMDRGRPSRSRAGTHSERESRRVSAAEPSGLRPRGLTRSVAATPRTGNADG
jgi:squalene synthase HpnC